MLTKDSSSRCSSISNTDPLKSAPRCAQQCVISSSTVNAGGLGKFPRSATISPQKNKRARLSPPEDDEECLRGVVMVDSVKNAIWTALNHYAFEDAVFAAERLYAEDNSEEAAFLLATSLYRAGNKLRAYSILSRCHPEKANSDTRYLFGKICCDLEEYQKAESILADSSEFAKSYTIEDVENLYKPETCSYALQMLGTVHQKSQRNEMAVEALKRASSLNPFHWSSFDTICRLKEPVDVKEMFFRAVSSKSPQPTSVSEDEALTEPFSNIQDVEMIPAEEEFPQLQSLPVMPLSPVKLTPSVKKLVSRTTDRVSSSAKSRMKSICEESGTPQMPIIPVPSVSSSSPLLRTSNNSTPQSSHSFMNAAVDARLSPSAKKLKPKPPFRATIGNSVLESPPISRTRRLSESSTGQGMTTSSAPTLRRSTRLQASKTLSNVKENKTIRKRDDFGSDLKLNRKYDKEDNLIKQEDIDYMEASENGLASSAPKKVSPSDVVKKEPVVSRQKRKKEPSLVISAPIVQEDPSSPLIERDRLTGRVMRSYCRFGEVVQAMHNYDIIGALAKLSSVNEEERESPFYWYLKGRLHFEILEYDKSVSAFAEMRLKDKFYIKGIDYYSVALWHLQREKDLAVLAKYLVENHRNAPETYIVYGNVFSLQRDHETAVKMFRRALQIAPDYAYALTLLGHEYVFLDEKEKAAQSFRLAIHADPFHYNGWCGLGQLAFKQEQFATALANFNRALEIYPKNPIILVHRGTAQHQLKQTQEALQTFTSAVSLFPNNPLCRFQRASLLFSMNRLDDAMQELQKLKDIAPKESLVYFLMGKVSKRTDNTHMALMYFSKAMDLDPKGTNNQIKEAFNKMYGGVDDDVVPQRAASGTTSSISNRNSDVL